MKENTRESVLTWRRSGLYPDLKSFEVAPRARLRPVRLRRVDFVTPELTACGEAFGFLVATWITPLSSWILIVCKVVIMSGVVIGGSPMEIPLS